MDMKLLKFNITTQTYRNKKALLKTNKSKIHKHSSFKEQPGFKVLETCL